MAADLSVIIPTFRRPRELREAISSVLSQTSVTVEVLVLDDSPEASAREVVKGIDDPRVAFAGRDVPSGGRPALLRNEGWPRTSGRYIHFLDDDDRVAAGAYRDMVAALDANPKKGVVFGKVVPFGDDPATVAADEAFFRDAARRARIAGRSGSRRWMVANMLFRDTVLVNSACVIRRECVAPLGGYDPRLPIVEDVDFYARAIRAFGCVFLDRVVLQYRVSTGSLMRRADHHDATLEAYRLIYADYRRRHGAAELLALKVFARTALRLL